MDMDMDMDMGMDGHGHGYGVDHGVGMGAGCACECATRVHVSRRPHAPTKDGYLCVVMERLGVAVLGCAKCRGGGVCARACACVLPCARARACVARQEPALFKKGGRAGRMVTAFHQVNRGTEEPRNRGTEEPRNRAEEGVEPGTSALEGRRDSRRAKLEVRQVVGGRIGTCTG